MSASITCMWTIVTMCQRSTVFLTAGNVVSAQMVIRICLSQRFAAYLCAAGEDIEPLIGPGSFPLVPGQWALGWC